MAKRLFIYQSPSMELLRKGNRNNASEAEKLLWRHLRRKQLAGYRFLRQYSVDHYILDFYCPAARLGIELDGGHHAEDETAAYDKIRTIHIESHNIRVIRFWNSEVKRNINAVLETIFYYL